VRDVPAEQPGRPHRERPRDAEQGVEAGNRPDRDRQQEVQVHPQVGLDDRQEGENRERRAAGPEHAVRFGAEQDLKPDLAEPGEHPRGEEEDGKLLRPHLALGQPAEKVDDDTVADDVAESEGGVGEHRRDPRPDVEDVARLEDEQGLKRGRPQRQDDDVFEDEDDPDNRQEHEGHVPAEVAEGAAGPGVDTEAVGDPLGPARLAAVHGVVEPAVEHPLRVVPVVQPRTVVRFGQPVFRTVGPPTVPTLVGHVLLFATDIALRHCRRLEWTVQRGCV